MQIISHRGYWKHASEKNTYEAFKRSFSLGYGTETDIRDYHGELVISHDIPDADCMSFSDFLKLHTYYDNKLPLALNIKSDGLAPRIKQYVDEWGLTNYFCFDMSIPDLMEYNRCGVEVYFRISEYEQESALALKSKGIWLDGFQRSLVNEDTIRNYIGRGFNVCCVSSELHKRSPQEEWSLMKTFDPLILNSKHLMLCTDFPDDAKEIFYGE